MALTEKSDAAAEVKEPVTQAAAATEDIKFTPREEAIMAGEDPDRVGEQAAQESTEIPPSTEAQTGGSTEAAKDTTTAASGAAAREAEKPWYSDEDRELASSYGMAEGDLKTFANADEFRRTAMLLDRQLAVAASRRLQAQAKGAGEGESAGSAKPAAPAKAADGAAKPAQAEEDFDPQAYIDAGYDEHTVKMAKRLKAEMERAKSQDSKLGQITQELQEIREVSRRSSQAQMQESKLRAFHDTVDKLDAKRFGRSVDDSGRQTKLDDATNDNRRKVFEATDILVLGIEEAAKQSGVDPVYPPYELLIRRAEQLLFAEQIQKDREQALQAKMAEQSRRRRPVAAARPLNVAAPVDRGTTQDEAQRLSSLPALKEMWHDMSEDSGKAA